MRHLTGGQRKRREAAGHARVCSTAGCPIRRHPFRSRSRDKRDFLVGKKKLERALKHNIPHEDITTYQLCREFGWTPRQVEAQDAKTIAKYILILKEMQAMRSQDHGRDDRTTTILIEDDEEPSRAD